MIAIAMAYGAAQLGSHLVRPGDASISSMSGEALIAQDLDHLFRSERALGDLQLPRAGAARILFSGNSRAGMQIEDRDCLNRLVARQTGLSADDATRRVNIVAA
jgi:hypothetical protein